MLAPMSATGKKISQPGQDINRHDANPPLLTHLKPASNSSQQPCWRQAPQQAKDTSVLWPVLLLPFLEPVVAAGVAQHPEYQLRSVLLAKSFRLACADSGTP